MSGIGFMAIKEFTTTFQTTTTYDTSKQTTTTYDTTNQTTTTYQTSHSTTTTYQTSHSTTTTYQTSKSTTTTYQTSRTTTYGTSSTTYYFNNAYYGQYPQVRVLQYRNNNTNRFGQVQANWSIGPQYGAMYWPIAMQMVYTTTDGL